MDETKILNEAKKLFFLSSDLELIGSGGQKKIYKGNDEKYGEIVVKLIELGSENTLKRALRELEIASRLGGREFPQLFKYEYLDIEEKHYLFVLEEYLRGPTLREFINSKEIHLDKAIHIGKSLLNGVVKVHNKNLVHRDIKPENIIIDTERIVLLDFGIARDLDKESLTADLAVFGPMTIGYAAPEQIKNQKKLICNRTDLFSWGLIMYEMIIGYNPLLKKTNNREEALNNTLTKKIPELDCGNKFMDVAVNKCLEKTVHRRPNSAEQILKIIEGEV